MFCIQFVEAALKTGHQRKWYLDFGKVFKNMFIGIFSIKGRNSGYVCSPTLFRKKLNSGPYYFYTFPYNGHSHVNVLSVLLSPPDQII